MVTLALADDHVLLRNGLASLLSELGYHVLYEADNGNDLIEKMNSQLIPQLVLMDINMPLMDGYETTAHLKKYFPDTRVLALSMYDDEHAIIRMLKQGARGYILKDSEPAELQAAIQAIVTKGFYHSELVTGKLLNSLHKDDVTGNDLKQLLALNDREVQFLKLACTDKTYKEIADEMNLSPRTIDGYRDNLFEKLQVKSRVGLVIFAIKNGIVLI